MIEGLLSLLKAHGRGSQMAGFVYVTHNTEYHVDDRTVCVAVHPRHGHSAVRPQSAIGKPITAVMDSHSLVPRRGTPTVGMRLCFGKGLSQVVTSPIVAIHPRLDGDLDG